MSAKVQKPGARPPRAKHEERPVPVRTIADPDGVHTPGRSSGPASSPSAVEYGILVAGLAVVIIALVFMLGPRLKKLVGAGGGGRPAPAAAPAGP